MSEPYNQWGILSGPISLGGTSSADNSSPLTDQTPEDDLWEDKGNYKRNKITGEIVWKGSIPGALPGINPDIAGISVDPAYETPDNPEVKEKISALGKLAGPVVQGLAGNINTFLIKLPKIVNRLGSDSEDKQDADIYQLMEEEFDKSVAEYTWGNQDSGGTAGEEFLTDMGALYKASKKNGIFSKEAVMKAGEAALDATEFGLSQYVDIVSSVYTGSILLKPFKMAYAASKWIPKTKPFLSGIAESVSKGAELASKSEKFKQITSSVSVTYGMREFMDREDDYTKAGLSQWVALPSAVAAGATQAYLEFLGSGFYNRLIKPGMASAMFNEARPKLWREMIDEILTEGAQGPASGIFRDIPLAMAGKGELQYDDWWKQSWQGMVLAPLGVGGMRAGSAISQIGSETPAVSDGVRTALKNGLQLTLATNPDFQDPTTDMSTLAKEDPKLHKRVHRGLEELLLQLAGKSEPDQQVRDVNLQDAYALTRKFSRIREVQDVYFKLLERYNGYNKAAEDGAIDASASAESAAQAPVKPVVNPTDSVVSNLGNRNLDLYQSIGTGGVETGEITSNAANVISGLGQLIESQGSLDQRGMQQVRASIGVLTLPPVYVALTRSQRNLMDKRVSELIDYSLISDSDKQAMRAEYQSVIEDADSKTKGKLSNEFIKENVKSAFQSLIADVRSAYRMDQDKAGAFVERAISKHLRIMQNGDGEVRGLGVGFNVDEETHSELEKKLESLQYELSASAKSAEGLKGSDIWKMRLYSYAASYLDKNSTIPSIPEGTLDQQRATGVIDALVTNAANRRRDFRDSVAAIRGVDTVAASLLHEKGSTPFSNIANAVKSNVLSAMQSPGVIRPLEQFIARNFGAQALNAFQSRNALAIQAFEIEMTKQRLAEAQAAGLDTAIIEADLNNRLASYQISLSDPARVYTPLNELVNYEKEIEIEDMVVSSGLDAQMKRIAHAIRNAGQHVPGFNLEEDSHNATATPSKGAQEEFWYQKSLQVLSEKTELAIAQAEAGNISRENVVSEMLNLMFSSSTKLALEAKEETEAKMGRRMSYKDILNLGGEIREAATTLLSFVANEVEVLGNGETLDLKGAIYRIKMNMIKAGGVRKRRWGGDYIKNKRTESSLLFNHFAANKPEELLPYLRAAYNDIVVEEKTNSGINAENASVILDALDHHFDNLQRGVENEDPDKNLRGLYNGNLREAFPDRTTSSLVKDLFTEGYKRALKRINAERTANGLVRIDHLTRIQVMEGAREYIQEVSRIRRESTGFAQMTPEQVLEIASAGMIGYLSGDETEVTQQVTAKSKGDRIADLEAQTQRRYKELNDALENLDPSRREDADLQDRLTEQMLQLSAEHSAAEAEIMASTTDSDAPHAFDKLTLDRAAVVYQRAQARYHQDRSGHGRSLSPDMTHSFSSSKSGPNDMSPIDTMWDSDIKSLIAWFLSVDSQSRLADDRQKLAQGDPMFFRNATVLAETPNGQEIKSLLDELSPYINQDHLKKGYINSSYLAQEEARNTLALYALNALKQMPSDLDVSSDDFTDPNSRIALTAMRDIRTKVFIQQIINFVAEERHKAITADALEPTLKEKIRIFRFDPEIPEGTKPPADYTLQALEESGATAASGRWFDIGIENMEWYRNDSNSGKGTVTIIELTKEEFEKYKVSNFVKGSEGVVDPTKKSRAPQEEVFVPRDLAKDSSRIVGKHKINSKEDLDRLISEEKDTTSTFKSEVTGGQAGLAFVGRQLIEKLSQHRGGYNPSKVSAIRAAFNTWVESHSDELRTMDLATGESQMDRKSGIGLSDKALKDFYRELSRNIEFASDPKQVGTLFNTSTKLKELIKIASAWNDAMLEEVEMAYDFFRVVEASGIHRWRSVDGTPLSVLMESIVDKTKIYQKEEGYIQSPEDIRIIATEAEWVRYEKERAAWEEAQKVPEPDPDEGLEDEDRWDPKSFEELEEERWREAYYDKPKRPDTDDPNDPELQEYYDKIHAWYNKYNAPDGILTPEELLHVQDRGEVGWDDDWVNPRKDAPPPVAPARPRPTKEQLKNASRSDAFKARKAVGVFADLTEQEKKAFYHVRSYLQSASKAIRKGGGPGGYVGVLTNMGLTPEEQAMNLALMNVMGEAWMRSGKKASGVASERSFSEFLNSAITSVVPLVQDGTKRGSFSWAGPASRYMYLNAYAEKVGDKVAEARNYLFNIPVIRIRKSIDGVIDPNTRTRYTFLHEFIHGVINSGAFSAVIGEANTKELERILSEEYGEKVTLPRMDPSENGKGRNYTQASKRAQEHINSMVTTVVIGNTIPTGRKETNKAIQKFRKLLLESVVQTNGTRGSSGFPLLGRDSQVSTEVSQIILGALSMRPEDSDKLFSLTDDDIIVAAAQSLEGAAAMMEEEVSILPLLAHENVMDTILSHPILSRAYRVTQHVTEALDMNKSEPSDQSLLFDLERIRSWEEFKKKINSATNEEDLLAALSGVGIYELREDKDVIPALREWVNAMPDDLTPVRLYHSDPSRNWTKGDKRSKPNPPSFSDDSPNLQTSLQLGTVGIQHQIGPVLEDIKRILGATADLPLTYDHRDKPLPVQLIISGLRKMGLSDKVIRSATPGEAYMKSTGPTTTTAEDILLRFGFTKEFLVTHTINGIAEFHRKFITDKVRMWKGSKWAGNPVVTNESLKDICEDLEQHPAKMDVWAFLAAKRQLEIERGVKIGVLTDNLDMQKATDKLSSAAARITLLQLNMKYGDTIGEVEGFARRLVKWQTAVTLDPMLEIGMINQNDYDRMRNSNEWYIPLKHASKLVRENPYIRSIFNDGTVSALKALTMDTSGSEHPIQQMMTNAVYVNYMLTAQGLRQTILRQVVEAATERGIDLRSIGIEPLMVISSKYGEWEPVTDPEEIKKQRAHYKKFGSYEKDMTFEYRPSPAGDGTIEKCHIGGPISTAGMEQFIKDNASVFGFEAVEKGLGTPNRKNVYADWKDGKPTYYILNDGELLDAIDGIHPTVAGGPDRGAMKWLYKLLRGATNLKTGGIVSWPPFVIGMVSKDGPTAFTRTEAGNPLGAVRTPHAFLQGAAYMFPSIAIEFPNFFRDFTKRNEGVALQASQYSDVIKTKFEISETGMTARQVQETLAHRKYRPLGGTKGRVPRIVNAMAHDIKAARAAYIANRMATMKNYSLILDTLVGRNNSYKVRAGFHTKIGSRVHLIPELLKGFATAGDSAWRMNERVAFRKLEDKGVPIQQLFVDYIDRNLTIDFPRKSPWLVTMNGLYAFAAPGFQDMGLVIKNLKSPTRAMPYLVRSMLAFSVPAIINWLRWHDDEDWQILDTWAKFSFFYFGKQKDAEGGDNGDWIRIPWGIGVPAFVFKDTITGLLQYASHSDPEVVNDLFRQGIKQSPAAFGSIPDENINPLEATLSTLAPSALDTSLEIQMNKDTQFTGNPIDPSVDAPGVHPTGNLVGRDKAGVLDVGAAKVFNALGLDWTPRQASYFITKTAPGWRAAAYVFANNLFTKANRAINEGTDIGVQHRPQIRVQQYVVSQMWGEKSQPVRRFMFEKIALYKHDADYNLLNSKNNPDAFEILEKYPELRADVVKLFKDTEKEIRELSKAKDEYINRNLLIGPPIGESKSDFEELVYASAMSRFDVPMTMKAGIALQYMYGVRKGDR